MNRKNKVIHNTITKSLRDSTQEQQRLSLKRIESERVWDDIKVIFVLICMLGIIGFCIWAIL